MGKGRKVSEVENDVRVLCNRYGISNTLAGFESYLLSVAENMVGDATKEDIAWLCRQALVIRAVADSMDGM